MVRMRHRPVCHVDGSEGMLLNSKPTFPSPLAFIVGIGLKLCFGSTISQTDGNTKDRCDGPHCAALSHLQNGERFLRNRLERIGRHALPVADKERRGDRTAPGAASAERWDAMPPPRDPFGIDRDLILPPDWITDLARALWVAASIRHPTRRPSSSGAWSGLTGYPASPHCKILNRGYSQQGGGSRATQLGQQHHKVHGEVAIRAAANGAFTAVCDTGPESPRLIKRRSSGVPAGRQLGGDHREAAG